MKHHTFAVKKRWASFRSSRLFTVMNLTKKRQIASWILLAVFVPMLVLSSVHIHDSHISAETTCTECVAHHSHSHFGQSETTLDACVLCQFLSLSFVATAVVMATPIFNVFSNQHFLLPCAVHVVSWGHIAKRGPPMWWLLKKNSYYILRYVLFNGAEAFLGLIGLTFIYFNH